MSDVIIYTILALIIGALLLFVSRRGKKKDEKGPERPRVPRPRVGEEGDGRAAPPPNRVVANRNARARMRVAAQRHEAESEEEEDAAALGDDIALPDGKVGKKKLAKLQAKADRRVQREVEEREREERKERKEREAEERKKEEEKEAEEEAKREEEERLAEEERERREHEEYLALKAQFKVEDEGFDQTDQDQEQNLLNDFVTHIKSEKVVVLEDLAAKFKLKTQDVINRVNDLQKEGTLTGVIDDRGKFIYISRQELEGVAKFIRQRGRVSLAELAESSNTLITLVPETPAAS